MKVVITGCVGAGKTTAIKALSDTQVISTDVNASDRVRNIKATTTVAMDYGELHMADNKTIELFGTPGQERFSYMWNILSKNSSGIIILVNHSKGDAEIELGRFITNFRQSMTGSNVAFGITHLDGCTSPSNEMKKYYQFAEKYHYNFPMMPVDARDKNQVYILLESLLASMEVGS